MGGNNIARSQGRITLHIERGEAKRVFAVAGAIGHQLLAVQKRRVERGVTLAVLSDSRADFTAKENLGFAVRANRATGFCRRSIDNLLHRKMLAVTQSYTEPDSVTGTAAALVHAFLPQRGRRNAADARRRRRRMGLLLRRPLLKAAEQEIKEPLSACRARHR